MEIISARIEDSKEISSLLQQLGYPDTEHFVEDKIKFLLEHPDEELLTCKFNGKIVALISLHFIPQLALRGDFARISYFAVNENFRSGGIGRKLEEYCVELAKARECDRIEVHCHSRRTKAHEFYYRQGYVESPKYLVKLL